MSVIPEQFMLQFLPVAAPEAVVRIGHARFTVLASRLIRLEYHPDDAFEDRASQAFWFRRQAVPAFEVRATAHDVEIETDHLLLEYKETSQGFTAENLSIRIKASSTVWHPGMEDDGNLRGTNRTLDMINGYAPLQPGLMSRSGWSVVNDSATLVFNEAAWLEPRIPGGTDLYFFGYGHDYKACLQDYCRVSGQAPMIPRWALGNWWSRYWAYTQEELTTLVEDFARYELPFSVCIIDMDWHLTETGNASTGWTGYTWNRKLFPDPKGFIHFAHDHGLKISLNLHPAEGIHPHEEQYKVMARRVGIDPATGQPVVFDITNPTFADAYFEVLHRPYEQMGVDFWWVDWQQGLKSPLAGLDPLWFINHLHFHDLGRDGVRRPFIFSRWGNEGHQRYPIGFSGDSYATWDSLRFQTYMTATASNIAYGWWSHDIGGHTGGTEDSELFTRWVQFGVLSPINRVHATKGFFYDRRPWAYEDAEVLHVLRDTLQLRHRLLPYLYTMARRAHKDSLPLVEPMYYDYPDKEAAYHCPHQYLFGTELVAAPFIDPADDKTGLSRQVVWLPEGDWYDFFTGEYLPGNQWRAVYGRLEDIPLYARAGAIIPLGPAFNESGEANEARVEIHLFAGADRTFTLYEDDGETTTYLDNHYAIIQLAQSWSGTRLDFTMDAPEGDTSVLPPFRSIDLIVHGIHDGVSVTALVNGSAVPVTTAYDADTETLTVAGIELNTASSLVLTIETDADTLLSRRDRKAETVMRLLKFFRLHVGVRNRLADQLDAIMANPSVLAPYLIAMSDSQARALFEVLYEAGIHVIYDTDQPTRIVLWNNRENDQITYRYGDIYLYFGFVQSAHHDGGPVPRFKPIIPPMQTWTHGAQGEHVHRTQWQAQVDYANLLSVAEGHREETP